MDPQSDLPDLVEDLEANIDELLPTLTPLLPPSSLSKTASSLPLLDKAKLHVLAAYAIESTLFSALQAHGTDPKAHAIFPELARLKSYFAKIKHAESHVEDLAAKEKRARLDVPAAQRFIKHGLSGNERYDELRRARVEAEKQRALDKARALTNRKFDQEDVVEKKRPVEDAEEEEGTPQKKARLSRAEDDEEEEDEEEEIPTPAPAPKKRGRKSNKTAGEGETAVEGDTAVEREFHLDNTISSQDPPQDPASTKKKRGRPSKKPTTDPSTPQKDTPQKDTPARATRSSASKAKPKRRANK